MAGIKEVGIGDAVRVDVVPGALGPAGRVFAPETMMPAGPLADSADAWNPGPRVGAGAGVARSQATSLVDALQALRRSRLADAAAFLAVLYTVLLAWNASTLGLDHKWVWLLMAARAGLAVSVAALLRGRRDLSRGQLRAAEHALFGGLTVLLVLTQYVVNMELIREKDAPAVVAFVKNGVIQSIMLMTLYGTFIPNNVRSAARVVAAMGLGPAVVFVVLAMNPAMAEVHRHLHSAEHAGSNLVFLLMGACLAVYGAKVLSGLRAELHEAQRYGQYRLVRTIGRGGMGEVFLAEHQLLKRPCALKLVRREAGADPTLAARFEREVRAASRLSHPNSIEIFDYGVTDDGTFYYVMEYLEGLNLFELVDAHGPLPPGRAVYLLRQVCAGLARAHSLGLVHRDLKPANVFVAVRGGETDVAKVLDYGLVKETLPDAGPALTADHRVSGTPLYMAPEQAAGSDVQDERIDIYALGACAYFVLTGRPPFVADSAMAVMIAHARDPVEPPSRHREGVPADLEALILKCLAKQPRDRYPDMKELALAFEACACAREWSPRQADLWWDERPKATGRQTPSGAHRVRSGSASRPVTA
jgi:serine/threonine protein kinase